MRILALDIGEKRTGIAISDASAMIASPVAVLPTIEVLQIARSFKRILDDYEPELIVAGLPKSLSGETGNQAIFSIEFAEELSKKTKLKVEYYDERLSTQEARRALRDIGLSEREMRGKLDKYAASLMLQSYLDLRRMKNVDNATS